MTRYEIKAGLAEIDAFDVIGVSAVTNNERGAEDINALWERFFEQRTGQLVADKINDIIYAVYSDYQGDHTKPYRLTIGYRVPDSSSAPQGLHKIRVIDQDYAVMIAAGEQPQALLETWQAVWAGDLDRSFATDFEIYGPRFFQDGLHEVLVHVGIRLTPENNQNGKGR